MNVPWKVTDYDLECYDPEEPNGVDGIVDAETYEPDEGIVNLQRYSTNFNTVDDDDKSSLDDIYDSIERMNLQYTNFDRYLSFQPNREDEAWRQSATFRIFSYDTNLSFPQSYFPEWWFYKVARLSEYKRYDYWNSPWTARKVITRTADSQSLDDTFLYNLRRTALNYDTHRHYFLKHSVIWSFLPCTTEDIALEWRFPLSLTAASCVHPVRRQQLVQDIVDEIRYRRTEAAAQKEIQAKAEEKARRLHRKYRHRGKGGGIAGANTQCLLPLNTSSAAFIVGLDSPLQQSEDGSTEEDRAAAEFLQPETSFNNSQKRRRGSFSNKGGKSNDTPAPPQKQARGRQRDCSGGEGMNIFERLLQSSVASNRRKRNRSSSSGRRNGNNTINNNKNNTPQPEKRPFCGPRKVAVPVATAFSGPRNVPATTVPV